MNIKLSNVVMRYRSRTVLDIDSLQFDTGKSYGLVGHNGAGKTTMFKCITNIISTYQGTIEIDGMNVKTNNEVLMNVGIVLDGMSVYKNNTGWFNIHYFSGLRGADNSDKAEALAKELKISDVLDQKVSTYSYGMQKKLVLLIALLHDPKILILDEPFRGLDVETVGWFKQYLKNWVKQAKTLIISSHVRNDLEELCEEVILIEEGVIQEVIDLTKEREKKLRIIDTSDNEAFREILRFADYPFLINDAGVVKLDIANPKWEGVYQELQDKGIMINEMTTVKVLEEKLN